MKTYSIAAIPGDGIGAEVIAAGIQVLESLARRDGGFALRFEHFDWGSNYHLKHGEMMPAHGLDRTWHCKSDRHFLCKAIETSPGHA